MARPKNVETANRLTVLPPVRCTEAERAAIAARAEAAGLTVSAYVRQASSTGRVVIRQAKADFALTNELRRIGVNLNQIAHAVHLASGAVPPELAAMLAQLDGLLDKALPE